jgi:ATP-dependent DNA helicase DinG
MTEQNTEPTITTKDSLQLADYICKPSLSRVISSPAIQRSAWIEELVQKVLGLTGLLAQTLPNFESRIQQIVMANYVGEVLLRYKSDAIIEAPTGSGKSMAYSVPAIIASKMQQVPVIISTSTKNLQAQLVEKDLPLLQKIFQQLGLPFTYTLCKGRANYLCLRRWHRFIDLQASKKKRKSKKKAAEPQMDMFNTEELAEMPESVQLAMKRQEVKTKLKTQEEKDAFDALMDWYITDPQVGDTVELGLEVNKGAIAGMWGKVCSDGDDCMRWQCPYSSSCYFMKAQKTWSEADLCIVNHSLFFANRNLLLSGGKGFLPETRLIVFDEADHVPNVAADFFGTEITSSWTPYMVDRFLPEVSGKGFLGSILSSTEQRTVTQLVNQLLKNSREYFAQIQKFIGKTKHTKRFKSPLPIDKSAFVNSIQSLLPYINRAKQHHSTANNKELTTIAEAFYKHFTNFLAKLNHTTTEIKNDICYFAQYSEKQTKYGGKVTITAIPLNTATMIQKSCKGLNVCYTSATLASDEGLSYFAKAVGVDLTAKSTVSIVLNSPFNFLQNCLLYMPDMPLPTSPEFDQHIITRIREVEPHIQGGMFVLFTSYSSMTAVSKAIRQEMEAKGRPFFVQGEDGPKNVLTQQFRDAKNGILLGVSSFWVGVDIQGDALSCVIITKMPFERPDEPFNEAMKEYLEQQGGSYFKDCDLPRATTMIRQGFGRLIRTKRDRGIVVILDPRLNPSSKLKKRYGDAVLDSLPECTICYELKDVADFLKKA